jgi:hypothetical protein
MTKSLPAEELENWFEDNGMEAMETMTEILKTQNQLALELTKLVLDHCKQDKRTQNDVFNIFKDAAQLVGAQMDID